jgi:hypothetical protein
MQDRAFIVAASIIRARKDSNDGFSRLKSLGNGLVAAHDGHQVVLIAEGSGSVLRKLIILH